VSTPGGAPQTPERAAPWFVPAGALIGFAGALCGIGGGIFAGPLLHTLRRVPLQRATASAILVVLATTTAATAAELVRGDSELAWPVVVPLALGALLGTQLGFSVSGRLDERALKRFFACILVLAGVRVLCFTSALGSLSVLGACPSVLVAAAIGVAGGFLTPLLGVAGGIVMVPALFLFLGQLGFGGARACALAAGALAALRSLWLHARRGNVSYALGLPLALGALCGALGGVVAAHDPLVAHGGRVLLGLVLLGQAVRFFFELRKDAARTGQVGKPG
jgi:hypothetical protein